MEHKHVRPYHEILRRVGAQNPGDLPLDTPVRLQAPADDFRHLVPPIIVPAYAALARIAADPAALAGTVELHVRGNQGIWLLGVHVASGLGTYNLITVAAPSIALGGPDSGSLTPNETNSSAFGDGRPSTCLFVFGTRAQAGGTESWRFQAGADDPMPMTGFPVYIAPGRVVIMQKAQNNSSTDHGFFWREIPVGGP